MEKNPQRLCQSIEKITDTKVVKKVNKGCNKRSHGGLVGLEK